MKPITALSLLAAAVALTACQSDRAPRDLPPVRQQQTGVDGAWVDPNGIVSTFASGTFTTRTTDTNQLLASGTYIKTSPTLVEINMTSLVRNTQSKVNCALVSQSQLNCTTAEGAQFSLARRA
ncbi:MULTISPECIES: outer membrane lipoprotein Omp10 [Rhizobiaceae]|uniref:outer membrane lipoprotein Omp10 n=1 Tax=Rhizobiaceae TaxID=82115 RepID=UPI00083E2E6F|nr:outer membrane lipoprotein Omp10 [Sinorhizobium sp. RAC02]AOF90560.1 outer membrane lipoprotein omp10 [Sinorhizobium sp. RAC02]